MPPAYSKIYQWLARSKEIEIFAGNIRLIDFFASPVISSGSKATRAKMSSIYLIRHGQASFGNQNYDRLSELGRRQCRLLGEWLARFGVRFDAAYSGDLERQRDSARQVAEAYAAVGLGFPQVFTDPAWNEYDSQAILTGSVPAAMAANPEIVALAQDMMTDGHLDLINNKKAFQRLFSRIMELWVDGKLNAEGYESWPGFVARVERGIDRVMAEQGGGKTVAVFTSGGPISAVIDPCSTPSETSCTACNPPKRFDTRLADSNTGFISSPAASPPVRRRRRPARAARTSRSAPAARRRSSGSHREQIGRAHV